MMPLVLAAVIGGGAVAHADVGSLNPNGFDLSGALDRSVGPTGRALEIAVGGGYTQGFGGAGGIGRVEDISGAGGNVEVQVGYRLGSQLCVGAYGTIARFRRGDAVMEGIDAYGATAGVQANWHGRPTRSIDPWIGVGAGWRGLWLTSPDQGSTTAYGLELMRLQLGIDYRITPGLAITPVIGASASIFLYESTAMTELTKIRDNRLNLYGFTGLLGRFDLGG
jgi:hypothetical protein